MSWLAIFGSHSEIYWSKLLLDNMYLNKGCICECQKNLRNWLSADNAGPAQRFDSELRGSETVIHKKIRTLIVRRKYVHGRDGLCLVDSYLIQNDDYD